MTALKKYQRLECPGLWRETPEAQRREVVVNFRHSSLILSDPRSELALSHWSLPAVERLNPGEMPALYAPGPDEGETLEIEDADMIAALSTVRGALEAARPRPGRLRNWMLGAALVAVVLAGFAMPSAVVSHTLGVLPAATRAKIGEMTLAEMVHLTGAPCSAAMGRAASETLSTRIFGAASVKVLIMRDGLTRPVHLPNQQILLPARLVEQQDNPAPAAGFALAEKLRAETEDPLRPVLQHAGTWNTLRLLTTGNLPASALDGYAETLIGAEPAEVDETALLARFAAAEVPSTPYARALGRTATDPLIAEDPWSAGPPREILSDQDWIGLGSICRQ